MKQTVKKALSLLLALSLAVGSTLSLQVSADAFTGAENMDISQQTTPPPANLTSPAESTASPSAEPVSEPTEAPTPEPSAEPTPAPTEEPTPTPVPMSEPTPMPDGLNPVDGVWCYCSNGVVDEDFTGLHKQFGTWFYIENGILNWAYTGLVKDFGTWFYVKDGVIDWSYSGLVKAFDTWFYVENGILNWQFTGLTKQFGTWFYVRNSVLDWGYTGLVREFDTWFYVEKSVLNWNFSGSVQHDGAFFTVRNGIAVLRVTGKTTSSANLRKGAGTSFDVIKVVKTGTALTVLEKTNSKWFKVELSDGTTGYLSASGIKVTEGDVNAIKRPEIDVSTLTPAEKKAKDILDTVGWDLRAAYNWSVHNLRYKVLSYSAADGHVHSEWYANYGFDNRCGNCYVYAATFMKMARLLGYDAYFIEGHNLRASGAIGNHGWVEIDHEDGTYVYDPEIEWETGRDQFKVQYGAPGTLKYLDHERVD